MSDWNTLFDKEKAIRRIPESIILLFIKILENNFKERPLKIWDLCCGAGRHTVALAGLGHEIYAS
ncbi:class I SAM-dependent methyltransferase, partial [Candidatus Dependentiae bacterium]|nr:class I SAM-dependent methyltransferase [Candidatus Dependentiae bacterium]